MCACVTELADTLNPIRLLRQMRAHQQRVVRRARPAGRTPLEQAWRRGRFHEDTHAAGHPLPGLVGQRTISRISSPSVSATACNVAISILFPSSIRCTVFELRVLFFERPRAREANFD